MRRRALGWTAAGFGVGVVLRYLFVVRWHDPRDFVYSDMAAYVRVARKLAAGAPLGVGDVTHPPGPSLLLGWLARTDPTLGLAVLAQFVVCALTPLVVGALARIAFGPACGAAATVVASLYYPLIEIGGFFLAEVWFTPLLLGTMALVLASLSTPRTAAGAVLAAAAGVGFAAAVAMKLLAIPTFGVVWLTYFTLTRPAAAGVMARRGGVVRLAAFALGALPLVALLVGFCTTRNDGHLCIAGNKGPADFLLGHYGRIASLHWTDSWLGNPPALLRGYTARPRLDFSMLDGARNLRTAWEWIGRHPVEALVLSLDHVYDTFSATPAWPSSATAFWTWAQLSAYFYLVVLFAPLAYGAVESARARGLRAVLARRAFLVLSPVVGLAMTVFVTNGEPRYRIAYDGILIALVCATAVHGLPRPNRV